MASSFLPTVLLAIALFAATNVDDLFILVVFFSDPKYRAREVVTGQFLGVGALVLISAVAALIALVIPLPYVGLLGLAPIVMGCRELLQFWRHKQADDDEEDPEHRAVGSGIGRVFAVAMVTIANGGDNIGVYTPLFAVRSSVDIALSAVIFTLMTAAWCLLAHAMVNHRTIGAPIRRYGHRVLPFVLIVLGLMILWEAGTLELLSQ